jgi:hypothetical protein
MLPNWTWLCSRKAAAVAAVLGLRDLREILVRVLV